MEFHMEKNTFRDKSKRSNGTTALGQSIWAAIFAVALPLNPLLPLVPKHKST
jgi:hypothetical protein